jgi:hypothetical protein
MNPIGCEKLIVVNMKVVSQCSSVAAQKGVKIAVPQILRVQLKTSPRFVACIMALHNFPHITVSVGSDLQISGICDIW